MTDIPPGAHRWKVRPSRHILWHGWWAVISPRGHIVHLPTLVAAHTYATHSVARARELIDAGEHMARALQDALANEETSPRP